MAPRGFTLFDTPIGPCGLVWGERGVAGVQLPETNERSTRARVVKRFPDAREAPPPAAMTKVIGRIVALLNGKRTDLSDIPLDMDGMEDFNRRVYQAALRIPPGKTLTYGEIAAQIGERGPGAAQAVGQALGRNPIPVIVPCHRVLAANGKTGGFSAPGGVATKLRLLAIENASRGSEPTLFDWAEHPAKVLPSR